jgi:hypothetical protein
MPAPRRCCPCCVLRAPNWFSLYLTVVQSGETLGSSAGLWRAADPSDALPYALSSRSVPGFPVSLKRNKARFIPRRVSDAGEDWGKNKFSIHVRQGRTGHESPGAPSFAFFAKGGIRECLHRDSWIPPFAKSAKDPGFPTTQPHRWPLVRLSEKKQSPFHPPRVGKPGGQL